MLPCVRSSKSSNAAASPCSLIRLRTSSIDVPNATNCSLAATPGLNNDMIVARNPVVAVSALTPNRVNVAMLAKTSSNDTPICSATPTTIPSVPANELASAPPARTAINSLFVACSAVMFASPYALIAAVTARETSFVSPRPTADAIADALSTSNAFAPVSPVDATTISPSASACGPVATVPDIACTAADILPTPPMPISVSTATRVIVASKSLPNLNAAPAPAASAADTGIIAEPIRETFSPAATALSANSDTFTETAWSLADMRSSSASVASIIPTDTATA